MASLSTDLTKLGEYWDEIDLSYLNDKLRCDAFRGNGVNITTASFYTISKLSRICHGCTMRMLEASHKYRSKHGITQWKP